jgi:hypothetical protein
MRDLYRDLQMRQLDAAVTKMERSLRDDMRRLMPMRVWQLTEDDGA